MRKTKLTEKDYNYFFKTVIYGKLDDPLYTSVSVSYRDLCRTISGFSKNPNHDIIFNNSKQSIYDDINLLLKSNINTQELFDKWHKDSCIKLIKISNNVLTIGQAQKWINMTLKNLSMLSHDMVDNIYEFCHVPIDNYILNATDYKLSCAWSRIDDYNEYLEYQKWFRDNYTDIPLDVEFKMWLDEAK